jgi:hypothetical protein
VTDSIIDVFIAKAKPNDFLADQVLHAVLNKALIPIIVKAGSEVAKVVGCDGNFTKEQASRIRADRSTAKISDDFFLSQVLKAKEIRVTVCLHRYAFLLWRILFVVKQLYQGERLFNSRSMRNQG